MSIECPRCGGDGCESCDEGQYQLTSCPRRYADSAWPLIRFAALAEKGLWPVPGGATQQSAAFVDACEAIWADQAVFRLQRMNSGRS